MFCGRNSGRDCDQSKETGLTPVFVDGTAAIEQAELVLVCRKLYVQEMKPEFFTDEALKAENINGDPMHTEFISEIVKVYVKD